MARADGVVGLVEAADARDTRRGVLANLAVNVAEALGLGIAAWLTGSVALRL